MRRIFLLCIVLLILPAFVFKYTKNIMVNELKSQKTTTTKKAAPSVIGNLKTVAYMDVIHLKSGRKIEGHITGYVDDVLLIEPVDGKGLMCPKADIKEIEKDVLVWANKQNAAPDNDMPGQLQLAEEYQFAGDEGLQLGGETKLAGELRDVMKRIPRFFESHTREIEELNAMIGQDKK